MIVVKTRDAVHSSKAKRRVLLSVLTYSLLAESCGSP